MSIQTRLAVLCDWPGCYYEWISVHDKIRDARKSASGVGMVTVDGLEFCGSPTAVNSHPDVPGNHAERVVAGPHRPTITPAGRRFHTVCSCGEWTSRTEHAEGSPSRPDAMRTWLWRHIHPDVVKPEREAQAKRAAPNTAGGVTV